MCGRGLPCGPLPDRRTEEQRYLEAVELRDRWVLYNLGDGSLSRGYREGGVIYPPVIGGSGLPVILKRMNEGFEKAQLPKRLSLVRNTNRMNLSEPEFKLVFA